MFRTTLDAKGMLSGWAVLIAIWSVVSYGLGVPEYLVASPGRVGLYVFENASWLIEMTGLTASQAVFGWLLGVFVGGIVGAGIFFLPWGKRLILPLFLALQTTPIIALAPLVTFWLGFGWVSKVAVASIVSMLPIVLAMYSGLGDAKPAHIYTFQLAGAGNWKIFWRVRLQSAWTSVLASLKVAAIFAVIGSIVAEFMGGNSGIGFLIMKAIYASKGDALIAAVLCSAVIGQVFLILLERSLVRWERRFGDEASLGA